MYDKLQEHHSKVIRRNPDIIWQVILDSSDLRMNRPHATARCGFKFRHPPYAPKAIHIQFLHINNVSRTEYTTVFRGVYASTR